MIGLEPRQHLRLLAEMLDRDQHVLGVEIRVILQLEREAGNQAPAQSFAAAHLGAPAQLHVDPARTGNNEIACRGQYGPKHRRNIGGEYQDRGGAQIQSHAKT